MLMETTVVYESTLVSFLSSNLFFTVKKKFLESLKFKIMNIIYKHMNEIIEKMRRYLSLL